MQERDPAGGDVEALMAERYGQPSHGRRRLAVVAVAVLAVGALGWLVWVAWYHSNPDVSGELTSYDVVSEHEVDLVVDVQRDSGDAVTCTVRVLAADHATVAEEDVTIPAGQEGEVRTEVTVTTERLGTTATVSGCH